MWAAIGIFAALNRRTATGEGCTVDTSLYETALGWMTMHTANYQASKRVARRIGSENAGIAPYKAFEASDGWIVIAAGNDNLFARLASALGRTQWSTEARFSTNPERVKNRETLNALIAEVIKSRPPDVWITELDAVGVPCAPMLALDEILAHRKFKRSACYRTHRTAACGCLAFHFSSTVSVHRIGIRLRNLARRMR
jgi:crotonobetainyl-CoA:carnitine CoA-transferase CaiB-like acyl-CoA transferase